MLRTVYIVIAFALFIGGVASAVDFSADMVSATKEGGSFTGKMFVSGNKSRMEVAGTISITRADKAVTWMIVPEQNMFIEQQIDLSKVAVTTDKIQGELERSLVGHEMVDGRMTDKYRVVYNEKAVSAAGPDARLVAVFQWIDPASGIPMRTTSEDGSWSVEYRNVVVGAQLDSLFERPQQYAKMAAPDMAAMIAAARQGALPQSAQTEEE